MSSSAHATYYVLYIAAAAICFFFGSSVDSSVFRMRVKSDTSINSSVGDASNYATDTLTVRDLYYYPPSDPVTSFFGLSLASLGVTTP